MFAILCALLTFLKSTLTPVYVACCFVKRTNSAFRNIFPNLLNQVHKCPLISLHHGGEGSWRSETQRGLLGFVDDNPAMRLLSSSSGKARPSHCGPALENYAVDHSISARFQCRIVPTSGDYPLIGLGSRGDVYKCCI